VIALHNILFATDFSEPSEAALAYARALATPFHAQIHVLHVLEDLAAHAWTTEVYVAALPGVHEEMERQARERGPRCAPAARSWRSSATPARKRSI
jgi:nucleotide-binding universal stress UspA family protein